MFSIEISTITAPSSLNSGSFLQTPFWCGFKARHGWEYRRLGVSVRSGQGIVPDQSFELAVLSRSFAGGFFSIAYVPLMPRFQYDNPADFPADSSAEIFASLIEELALALRSHLPRNTIAVRFDPDAAFSSPDERDSFNRGVSAAARAGRLRIRKSGVDIQPPDTSLVDLTASEDEILARMHQKWRYNIRLSERKGVTIKKYEGDDKNLSEKIDIFYKLTKETNARDGNSSHARSYYQDLIASSASERAGGADAPVVSLYVAEHEGDEIASIMTLFSRDEAVYLYGASGNIKRNLMPNHLLQWTAMRDAKAYGSRYYDLYGMPPEGKDESHPMHGLYMFKANFGGKIIHRTGSWDVPLRMIYRLYVMAERFRAFWHKKLIKKLKGR